MILAGIDEAGYGPLLGPLVVGCCAFEVPEESLGGSAELLCTDVPCLWKRLRRAMGKKRDAKGRKIHVNDSKIVYSPAGGLRELERSVLALVGATGECCESLEALVGRLSPATLPELGEYRWYAAPAAERFPLELDATSVRLTANAVRTVMEETGTRCVHLAARVIPERETWLYDNPTALGAVRRGLKQARQRKLSAGPDLGKAAALAGKLEDN